MEVKFETSLDKVSADTLAVVCFETAGETNGSTEAVSASATNADPQITAQSGWMSDLRASGEFTGKLYEIAILHRPEGIPPKRLVVVGAGKSAKYSSVESRRIAGVLVRSLKSRGVRNLAVLANSDEPAENITALVEGAILGDWEAHKYKSDPKKNEGQIESFKVDVPGAESGNQAAAVQR